MQTSETIISLMNEERQVETLSEKSVGNSNFYLLLVTCQNECLFGGI